MEVVAKEKIYYGGKDRYPGETFEMDDRQYVDINILLVTGKIEKVRSAAEGAPKYRTKVMEPELQPPPKEEAPKPKEEAPPPESQPQGPMTTEDSALTTSSSPGRRVYRRRDMRSER
jgi:hypothetical protein